MRLVSPSPASPAWVVFSLRQRNFFRYPDGVPVLLTERAAKSNAEAWTTWFHAGEYRAVPWDDQAKAISKGAQL